MSHGLMSAISRSYRGPRHALPVLLVLADHADMHGIAWPSVGTIAKRCQLHERQVRHHLSTLAAEGYLRLVGSRAGGRALSAHWQITVNPAAQRPLSDDKPGSPQQGFAIETRQSIAQNPAVNCNKPGSTLPPKQSRTYQEHMTAPSRYHEHRPEGSSPVAAPGFERFWNAYPKKKAKADAIKAWNKLNPDETTARRIVAQVELAACSRDWRKDGGQFIPYPATYLNGRRFDDELVVADAQRALVVAL